MSRSVRDALTNPLFGEGSSPRPGRLPATGLSTWKRWGQMEE